MTNWYGAGGGRERLAMVPRPTPEQASALDAIVRRDTRPGAPISAEPHTNGTVPSHPAVLAALANPMIVDGRPGSRHQGYPTGSAAPYSPLGYFTDHYGYRIPYGRSAQPAGWWLECRCANCHTHYGDIQVHGSGVHVIRCVRAECRKIGKDRTPIYYGFVEDN